MFALFLTNFNFNIIGVFCPWSIILTIAIPDISSTNGASIGINFFSPGFTTTCSLGNIGIDLLKNLKHDSQESITPNSNNFLFPKPYLHYQIFPMPM